MDSEINSRLYHKAQSLMANSAYLKKCATYTDKVVSFLRQHSGYSVGRHLHSGGSANKILIPKRDYEIIVLVNDEEPPFQILLLGFEKTFKEQGAVYDLDPEEIKRTPYSLHITLSDFYFELIPAANYVLKTGFLTGEEQQKKILEKIKKDPERHAQFYHSGLAESRGAFLDKQTSFVNEMVRIAKFWYQEVVADSIKLPIAGSKSLIELIMIQNAINTEKKNYVQCFRQFLTSLQNFDKLEVVFEDVKAQGHKILPEVREKLPIVVDPVNPYNNLAKYWDTQNKQTLKEKAQRTEQRISKYKLEEPIDRLFQ